MRRSSKVAVDPAPGHNGTLVMPVDLDFDLGKNAAFDIAGMNNVAHVAGTPDSRSKARLWRIDLATGETRSLGRIDNGQRAFTITRPRRLAGPVELGGACREAGLPVPRA
jgi:hypothetical protein